MPDAAWRGDPPIRVTRWMPTTHVPHPPQHAFLSLEQTFEVLYGGAAGGGKSDALLMAALQYVDVPGYAALLLRRTMQDLDQSGALIPRSKEWLMATDASWNDNKHRWTFPSGAVLEFGYLAREDDKLRYQGTEYDFIGFDELTQFTESQYTYLASRLRPLADGPGVPSRLRGATNPGGPGHRWVKRRLIDREPNPQDPDDTLEKCAERVFIPARVIDNPSVAASYATRSLGVLDPQTRKQLLEGDWNARPPGDWVFPQHLDQVFELGAAHDAKRLAEKMPPPVGGELILAADWGVHSHLLLLWPLEAGGCYVVREFVFEQQTGTSVRQLAQPIVDAARDLGYPVRQERFDASMPGLNEAFLERLRELIGQVRFTAIPFGKFKALAIDYLRLLAHNTGTGEVAPVLSVSPAGCPVLVDQLRGWHYADVDTGRIDKEDDHGPDALVAGVAPDAAMRAKQRNLNRKAR